MMELVYRENKRNGQHMLYKNNVKSSNKKTNNKKIGFPCSSYFDGYEMINRKTAH